MTHFNLWQILHELGTREQCIQFAEEKKLILAEKKCRTHRKPMRIDYSTNETVGSFACTKGNCRDKPRSRIPRGKNTWFENVKMSLPRIFYLMYSFSQRWSYDNTIFEDPYRSSQGLLSDSTIASWFSKCRDAVVKHQLEKQNVIGKIGGAGKVVQIGESQFGKPENNQGSSEEGHWVLGIIENDSEDLRLEVIPENNRSAEVFLPLIQKHVAEGSIIHTGSSPVYDGLEDHGFVHKRVSANPDNPVDIQRIKAQWQAVKRHFRYEIINSPYKEFEDMLVEYLWRRDCRKNKKDPFDELIKAVQFVYGKK